MPADLAALEALPGVGHKTASVVMVQAFGVPAFPVDTHIHRLAGRWGLSRARNVAMTERDLKRLFPREHWGKVHLQIIYFGREHCPARGHDLARVRSARGRRRRRGSRARWRVLQGYASRPISFTFSAREIDAVETAHVDRAHLLSVRSRAARERADPARGQKKWWIGDGLLPRTDSR